MSTDLRITGIMSGMDTESMIESLMAAERVKVDRVKQDRQLVLWRQEIYNDVNKSFANFIINTRKLFGLTSITSTGAFTANSYQKLNWVKKATSSNPAVATVSSTSGAFEGTYSVKVKQLAEGVSMVSRDAIGAKDENGNMMSIAKLLEENGQKPSEDLSKIKFKINGRTFVIGNLDKDENGNIIDPDVMPIKNEKGEITGYDAYFIDGDLENIRLNAIVNLINSDKDVGVRANYDSSIDRFFLQTKETGKNAQIEIEADGLGRTLFEKLNLKVSYKGYVESDGTLTEGTHPNDDGQLIIGVRYTGQDAEITFNGAENIISPSNTITINGITMNLTGITEDDKPITITVGTDVDGVYEKISKFLEEYNNLVDKVNGLLTQKRYYDYKPLTDAQKKEMDEKEIELWEEKAKSGLLRNDDILQRTMQNVRSAIYKEFGGAFKLITEIGITTEGYTSGSVGGKLIIKDEEKLRQAIANDAEGVMELLFKEGTDNEGGIVTRIYNNLMTGMEDIIKKSGTGGNANLYRSVKTTILLDFVTEYSSISLLDKNISDYNNRIDDLNYALANKENYYYKKFSALETALSRMNAQSMWLTQQFSNY